MKNTKLYKRILACLTVLMIILSCTLQAFSLPDTPDKKVLTVGVFTDRCPVFYVDPEMNEIVGIGADLMRYSAHKAGFNVIFKQIEEETIKDALDNDAYDVLMPFGSAVPSTSGKPTIISKSIINTPFTLVTKGCQNIVDINSMQVGMLTSLGGVGETVKQMYPDISITFYDTIDDSVKALRAGKVDALLNNSFNWSYVLQKPSYSDLRVNPAAMFSVSFCVGAADTPENRELIEQLNWGIAQLTDARREAIMLDYTSRRLYKNDLGDIIYKYKLSIFLMILLIAAVVMITIQNKKVAEKEHEEKLRKLINEDSLTCALSLHGFRKRVTKLLRDNPNNHYLILYTNMSNFKYINDSEGMEAGDKMLRFFANKVDEILTDEEAMCRLEGDHFAILRHIRDEEQLRTEYKNITNLVRKYFIDKGKDFYVRIYGGVYVLTPSDFENVNVDHMIDLAREAEKKVRTSTLKEGFEILNHEEWVKGKRRSDMVSHFPTALQSGEIVVWYQPKVDYSQGKIISAEALCRWKHHELGWISPGEFIPALEKEGLIRELDFYIWEEVCKHLKKWNESGEHRTVSVNLSRSDIGDGVDIPTHFRDLIHKYDLTPDQLKIEITETVFTDDPRVLIETTRDLKASGFTVEMDDFGSGYSSLNILKDVPVDVIKLDLLFLRKSDYPEKSRTIITHIVKMVQELGMEIIVEGVETKEQADFLMSRGCSQMQGYYFYKPMPLEDYENALKNN